MIISKYLPFYFILIFHLLICYLFSFLLSAKFLYIVYSNDKVMIKNPDKYAIFHAMGVSC